MSLYDPNAVDARTASEKLLDINKRLSELPRLRQQEQDRADKGVSPDDIDKQLARIAKTEDILLAHKMELGSLS